MTGNHVVDLILVTLGPLIIWKLFWANAEKMTDAEAMILSALCVATRETLNEAQLKHCTGLNVQELALDRLHDQVRRSNGRVTLR